MPASYQRERRICAGESVCTCVSRARSNNPRETHVCVRACARGTGARICALRRAERSRGSARWRARRMHASRASRAYTRIVRVCVRAVRARACARAVYRAYLDRKGAGRAGVSCASYRWSVRIARPDLGAQNQPRKPQTTNGPTPWLRSGRSLVTGPARGLTGPVR